MEQGMGLLSVGGGKLSAYRAMAERIVDTVIENHDFTAKPCTTADVPLPGGDAEVLASDATPRGEAEAPRMVRPDDEVNPEFLAMELAQNRTTLEELRTLGVRIADAKGWIPHQELGALAAPHWLRFAALHARHHWAIVRDVLAA